MNGVPSTWDSWARWATVILVLLGFGWDLAGRLSRIEQQLADDAEFHKAEASRLDFLEREVTPYIERWHSENGQLH